MDKVNRISHNVEMSALFSRKKRIYLDYAAATPVRKEVLRAMEPFHREAFGNASAVHREGQVAREAIETSRATVARMLRIRKNEVHFVSGGTEANNLAILGVLEGMFHAGRIPEECEVITTALEHPSILGALEKLKEKGVVVHTVPVDGEGLINHALFEKLLSEKTILVIFAYANSEIGVVQDVKRITRAVRKSRTAKKSIFPLVHLDASQAPLYLSCEFDSLGVDLMTLDAGKCYGPKGIGIFVKKHGVPFRAPFQGGDQEGGVRPGTESTALIVGCALSLEIAERERENRVRQVESIREYAFEALLTIPGVIVNGSRDSRIANNINISIPGIDGEYATVVLDTKGIAVSTKSACSGATGSGSSVIYALGGDDARALSTLRITVGEETTKRNIDVLVRVLKEHVVWTREKFDQLTKK